MGRYKKNAGKKRPKPYTHLTAAQKQEICKRQRDNPRISSLGKDYAVRKSTIQYIIAQSEKWLAIDINEICSFFCHTMNR